MPAESLRSSPAGVWSVRRLAHELRPAGAVGLEEPRDAARQRPVAELGLPRALEGVDHLDRRLGLVALLRQDAPLRHQAAHHVAPLVRHLRRLEERDRGGEPGQQGALAGQRVEMKLADPLLRRRRRAAIATSATARALNIGIGGWSALAGATHRAGQELHLRVFGAERLRLEHGAPGHPRVRSRRA